MPDKPLVVQGVIPSVVTPFTPALEIDEGSLRRYVRRFRDIPGVTGVLCGAYTGEVNSLSEREKIRIVEICRDEVAPELLVYSCVDAHSTPQAIEAAKAAKAAGADAVQINSPFKNPLRHGFLQNQEVVVDYFRQLDAVGIPMTVFQYPEESGLTYPPESLSRIADIPNVVGIKEAVSIDRYIDDYRDLNGRVALIADNNYYGFLAMLLRGADATMVGISNVGTELFAEAFVAARQGDFVRAVEMTNTRLLPLMDTFVHSLGQTSWSFVARVKEALVQQELIEHGVVRSPEPQVTEEDREAVRMGLVRAGLL